MAFFFFTALFFSEKNRRKTKMPPKTPLTPHSYVTAWNNLGDAREKRGEWAEAAKAYAATLALDPANAVARARAEAVRARAGASSSGSSSS